MKQEKECKAKEDKKVYSISKAEMLEVMLDELHSALENGYDSIIYSMWLSLFNLDRDSFGMYGENYKTVKIKDVNGEVKDMNRDDIDDFICNLSWNIRKNVENCIKNPNGSIIILREDDVG